MNSSEKPCCGVCKWAEPNPVHGESFFCTRFPPTACLVNVTRHAETKAIIGTEQLGIFPIVNAKTLCGEFSPKDETKH